MMGSFDFLDNSEEYSTNVEEMLNFTIGVLFFCDSLTFIVAFMDCEVSDMLKEAREPAIFSILIAHPSILEIDSSSSEIEPLKGS
jgi:hypothetical protein